jgi:hypothetical protein
MSKNYILTPEQREFCHQRHDNPNISATECVYRAYPGKFKTYSSAASHASRLLKSAKIQRYLDELSRRTQNRIGATIGRILAEEAKIAFFDPAELIDPVTRDIRALDRVPAHLRRAIASVRIVKTQSLRDPDIERTEYRYKFFDKGNALARLERILGMYEKDWEQQRRNLDQPTETKSEKWVLVPTDRELTLKEWAEQVDELNRYQEQKRKQEQKEEANV